MFKKKENKPSTLPSQDVTVINKGTTIKGEVKASGTIRIYGHLNGTVRSDGKVIIAENGVLNGDLYAGKAEVSGTVEGVIEADRLDLRSTATVEGNVVVKKFTTETGAIFVGDCKMPQNGALPSSSTSSNEASEILPEDEAHDEQEEAESPDAASASEPEGDGAAAEPIVTEGPQAEPVETATGGSGDEGGVKPIPNKPANEESTADEEAASAETQESRARFW